MSQPATYRTPKLGIVAFRDNGTLAIRSQNLPYFVESTNELLRICTVDTILGRLAHGDDEDVAIIAVQRKILLVDDGLRHDCVGVTVFAERRYTCVQWSPAYIVREYRYAAVLVVSKAEVTSPGWGRRCRSQLGGRNHALTKCGSVSSLSLIHI